MERPNLRIIETGEQDFQLKDSDNIFNKIEEEKIFSLKKDMSIKVQEAYRTSNRMG